MLGSTIAWHSKRQRTTPTEQQHQQQQEHQHQQPRNPLPQDFPPAYQHTIAEHPTRHPASTYSNLISRHNHNHQQRQQELATHSAPAPAPAPSDPWHVCVQVMQGTASGSLSWADPAAAAPGAPIAAAAPAPALRQKQRQPQQQQQQQHMRPSTSFAPEPSASSHAFQAGTYQQCNSSSRDGSVDGDRGTDGVDLWGAGEREADATAGQQQQWQQQLQGSWGEDEANAGQEQHWHPQQQWQQQHRGPQIEGDAGQQEWSNEGYPNEGVSDGEQQQWEGGIWGEEVEAEDAEQQQQQQDDTEGEGKDGECVEDDEQQKQQEEEGEQEVHLESAEFDLSRDDVIERIEQLAYELISGVAAGQLPTLSCISTARSNIHMAPRHSTLTTKGGRGAQGLAQQGLGSSSGLTQQALGAVAAGPGYSEENDDAEYEQTGAAAAAGDQLQQQQHVLRLGSKVQTKSLMASGGAQANSIVRAIQLLDSVHALLRSGRNSTQRDVYYNLVGRPGFQAIRDVSTAIRSVLGILRVPRSALGISAASKGAVAGCLLLRPRPGEPWADCRSVGPSGRPIPGEVGAVDTTALRPAGARFILVVEKDAVFQSLVESRLHELLPCIIITGRGMPDVASRAFLAAVVEASKGWGAAATAATGGYASLSSRRQQQQSLPVLGLVDWNPGGVSILLAYKYGAAALGLESARYAVPSLCWLGVTSHMLQEALVPQSRCHALSDRDRTLMPGLKARLAGCPDWVQELEEMEGLGLKADIEALQHDDLMRQVQQRVLQGSYLR